MSGFTPPSVGNQRRPTAVTQPSVELAGVIRSPTMCAMPGNALRTTSDRIARDA
jgi:hypothetical protein